MPDPSAFSVIAGFALFLAFIGLLILAIGLCRAAARPVPKVAAPAPEVQPVQARAHHCTVPFCDDRVQVFIPVGVGDTWTFCLPHGLPFLTAESAQQRKGGAA